MTWGDRILGSGILKRITTLVPSVNFVSKSLVCDLFLICLITSDYIAEVVYYTVTCTCKFFIYDLKAQYNKTILHMHMVRSVHISYSLLSLLNVHYYIDKSSLNSCFLLRKECKCTSCCPEPEWSFYDIATDLQWNWALGEGRATRTS